ncbi:stage 0 sporulation protein [Patescibacteria group bacterium]|nr:stage 0 sporulation protein [Patescibacteria group bacterium]
MGVGVLVQLASWEGLYGAILNQKGKPILAGDLQAGQKVIIRSKKGTDLGTVVRVTEEGKEFSDQEEKVIILRKASAEDIKNFQEKNKAKKKAIKACEDLAKKRELPIKVIDALFSFDGGRVTFAFVAPNRVDFRLLVKDLAHRFHKSIRMHQVGARQETCLMGDIGPCGRPLCCLSFLKNLGQVTTEMMAHQSLSQRGPERLSGICGRLKCCLSFEEEAYKEALKDLPSLGSKVKTKQGPGQVKGYRVLERIVIIKTKNEFLEVPLDELKF